MHIDEAISVVLERLRQQRRLTNAEMLHLLGSDEALLRAVRESLILDDLAHDKNGVGLVIVTQPVAAPPDPPEKVRLFLSYGRRDAKDLADRLCVDLASRGYGVWRDTVEITAGTSWQHAIADGLRSAQVVISLLSPHAVRTTRNSGEPHPTDSVCLGEIAYALFNPPPRPVVPVMAVPCEAPLAIFHLDYVEMTRWRDSEEQYRHGVERLVNAIEAALRGEKHYRSWHHLLQPWDFTAFLHEKRRDFTGREWLLDELDPYADLRCSPRCEAAGQERGQLPLCAAGS